MSLDEIVDKLWYTAQTEVEELHGDSYTLPEDITKEQAKAQIQALVAEVIGGDDDLTQTDSDDLRVLWTERNYLRDIQRKRAKERGLL